MKTSSSTSSYVIDSSKAGKIGKALASQLAPDKAGAHLITDGFSQDSFTAFIAELAVRAIAKGCDATALAGIFRQVAACNASQARQALADVGITVDDGKLQSLSVYWGKTDRGPVVDLSLLGDL